MSRSGYHDDPDDQWAHIRWRGAVASATRGKRGQAMLRDLADALDAMPEKKLIAHELKCNDGVCALGALAEKRAMDVSKVDPEDSRVVASVFDVAEPLVQELVYMNDEAGWHNEAPENRWRRMRDWVASQIKKDTTPPKGDDQCSD